MTVWMKREQMISIVDIAAMEIGVGEETGRATATCFLPSSWGSPRGFDDDSESESCRAHVDLPPIVQGTAWLLDRAVFPRLDHPPSPARLDLEWRG